MFFTIEPFCLELYTVCLLQFGVLALVQERDEMPGFKISCWTTREGWINFVLTNDTVTQRSCRHLGSISFILYFHSSAPKLCQLRRSAVLDIKQLRCPYC